MSRPCDGTSRQIKSFAKDLAKLKAYLSYDTPVWAFSSEMLVHAHMRCLEFMNLECNPYVMDFDQPDEYAAQRYHLVE